MSSRPLWADALTLFDYCFYTITDLLFIVFGLLIVAVVARPGWRHHLRWANPSAASAILTGFARLIRDLHFFFGAGARWNSYIASSIFYYLATVAGLYGTILLWQTLRDLGRSPVSPDAPAQYPPQPGVWPPAPTLRRD